MRRLTQTRSQDAQAVLRLCLPHLMLKQQPGIKTEPAKEKTYPELEGIVTEFLDINRFQVTFSSNTERNEVSKIGNKERRLCGSDCS